MDQYCKIILTHLEERLKNITNAMRTIVKIPADKINVAGTAMPSWIGGRGSAYRQLNKF